MKIILASGSPRRKELLKLIVPEFEVLVSGIDEKIVSNLKPQEQAMRLAYMKAKDVYNKSEGERIVIGADTIVEKDYKVYGKPENREHAKKMIKELLIRDKKHTIITGLCIILEKEGRCREFKIYDEVDVYLRDMSEEEIDKWLDSGNAMDKAGAYGIQNEFCVFVDRIEGNYTSAVGLPTHRVYEIIKDYI